MTAVNLKISTISPNLRPEEYHIQLADSLIQFKNVKEVILNRIRKNIDNRQANLKMIKNRIKNCQERIENLRGKKDATKILNKSKYPGDDAFDFNHTIFSFIEHLGNIKHRYREIQSKFDQLEIAIKPVPCKEYHFPRTMKQVRADRIGISGPPGNLPSISSLILFNTNVHVYKKYVITSPLEDASLLAVNKDDDDSKPIAPGDAPFSLAAGNEGNLWIPPRQDLFYMPGLGAVPDLDSLPEVLPDLGGVAMNSGFTLESWPSLAPSAALIDPSLLSELPEVPDEAAAPSKELSEIASGSEIFPSLTIASPPPPPPPPPPVFSSSVQQVALPEVQPSKEIDLPELPKQSDEVGRGDLLRQIVETGGLAGAKLRSSKQKSKQKSSANNPLDNSEKKPEVALSMFEDLQKRLAMRRMGMVGKHNTEEQAQQQQQDSPIDVAGVLKKMSDKIPYQDKSRDSNFNSNQSRDPEDSDWSDD